MQNILYIFSIFLFLYIFYILFFESRYSRVRVEFKYEGNVQYTLIWYKDKNIPGIQKERIDGVHFNYDMVVAHFKSKNIYHRRKRIKFFNYKD